MSKVSRWVDKHVTHSSERRQKLRELNEQIQSYQNLQNKALQDRQKYEAERDAAKRRAEEKEVRARRSRYRMSGFLENVGSDSGTSDTVG